MVEQFINCREFSRVDDFKEVIPATLTQKHIETFKKYITHSECVFYITDPSGNINTIILEPDKTAEENYSFLVAALKKFNAELEQQKLNDIINNLINAFIFNIEQQQNLLKYVAAQLPNTSPFKDTLEQTQNFKISYNALIPEELKMSQTTRFSAKKSSGNTSSLGALTTINTTKISPNQSGTDKICSTTSQTTYTSFDPKRGNVALPIGVPDDNNYISKTPASSKFSIWKYVAGFLCIMVALTALGVLLTPFIGAATATAIFGGVPTIPGVAFSAPVSTIIAASVLVGASVAAVKFVGSAWPHEKDPTSDQVEAAKDVQTKEQTKEKKPQITELLQANSTPAVTATDEIGKSTETTIVTPNPAPATSSAGFFQAPPETSKPEIEEHTETPTPSS